MKILAGRTNFDTTMEEVRSNSARVAHHSSRVTLNYSGIANVVDNVHVSIPKVEWDFEGIHYFDNGPLTVQYLFVLDALNFCFFTRLQLRNSNCFRQTTIKPIVYSVRCGSGSSIKHMIMHLSTILSIKLIRKKKAKRAQNMLKRFDTIGPIVTKNSNVSF